QVFGEVRFQCFQPQLHELTPVAAA
ncbi:MAG: hypothetical protein RL748_138, partial [Pseudomonadota bacterium]